LYYLYLDGNKIWEYTLKRGSNGDGQCYSVIKGPNSDLLLGGYEIDSSGGTTKYAVIANVAMSQGNANAVSIWYRGFN
jgi:hypothetical protein